MKQNKKIPEPIELEIKSSQYQPSKAEKEVEIDMPGMNEEELRVVFMRPFKVREES